LSRPKPANRIRRGDIWWINLDPTQGSEIKKTRPCLVLTADALNDTRFTAVVVPYSTAPRAAPPLTIPVQCDGQSCVAVLDQIRAVAKERFHKRIGSAAETEMSEIAEGLKKVLELW
jgi:mRNA interferase MazF